MQGYKAGSQSREAFGKRDSGWKPCSDIAAHVWGREKVRNNENPILFELKVYSSRSAG